MSKLAERLERIVLDKIAKDTLVIPPLPAVASECLNILREPEFSNRTLAAAIEKDPVLLAQVLRTATSAAAGGGARGMATEQAVARIGQQKVRSIVIELCAHKLFASRDDRIAAESAQLWEHSLAVGLLARDLAALTGALDAEAANLAGLLHDVGKPVIAAVLLDAERLLAGPGAARWITPEDWLAVVDKSHRTIAIALAERWKLPEPVVAAIRDCGEYDMADRKTAANYVRFANAAVKLHGIPGGPFDPEDAKTMVMLGRSLLGVDDELLERLTKDLRDRLRSGAPSSGSNNERRAPRP